jgi:hypothetical protein
MDLQLSAGKGRHALEINRACSSKALSWTRVNRAQYLIAKVCEIGVLRIMRELRPRIHMLMYAIRI